MNIFQSCDLIIQSGAPAFWANTETNSYSHQAEWVYPLWYGVISVLHNRIPVFNIGVGSCVKYGSNCFELFGNKRCVTFLKDMLSFCKLTTVRDRLALNICRKLGASNTQKIICPSILAAKRYSLVKNERGKYVVFNYMKGGGHFYMWDKRIHPDRWETIAREVIKQLSKKWKVKMLCHSIEERKEARKVAPECEFLQFSNSYSQLLELRNAEFGICNRVHASMSLASLGIPSVTIGSDSRALLIEELNLPHFFVGDQSLSTNTLLQCTENILNNYRKIHSSLIRRQRQTEIKYIELLTHIL